MSTTKLYDVLIVGGGPAGLSAAGALARQTYNALILDSKSYRNARTKHMHNVPGYDHADPEEFRSKARDDLRRRYETIEYKSATITEAKKLESGVFELKDEEGHTYQGKKLALGTGVRDMLEDEVPGYDECWGRGIFHCLFCHGFEERGAESVGALASGMLAAPEMIIHVSKMAKRLSKSVTIYTHKNPELYESLKPLIHSSKIHIDNRPIASFALVGDGPQVEMTFEDGSKKIEGFVVSHPKVEQRAAHLVQQLGLETTPSGDIQVNPPFNETSVKGCFAGGDAASPMKAVVQAVHMGMFAGGGLVTQLQNELEEKDEL